MCLYACCSYASIIATEDFCIVKQHLATADTSTLVIFDIDEVLLESTDAILKPQFKPHFLRLQQELAEKYSPEEVAYFKSIIYDEHNFKLVNDDIINTLNDLKHNGVMTIAITYIATGPRGKIPQFEDWGLARLQKVGIDFRRYNNLKNTSYTEIPAAHGVPLTKNGVTFTALASKGSLLEAILKHNALLPAKVIFIDDKLSNLESVQSSCEQLNISFLGIHYTAVINSKAWKYNEAIARQQFNTLEQEGRWLSDAAAQQEILPSH